MQDFYYDEIDELLLEGTDINDVSQEVDKLKKIIATLTIVCGILIGICVAKHVKGNRKYSIGRDHSVDSEDEDDFNSYFIDYNSCNDYNDFNSTDNSDAFNKILYMIEGTDNRKENLSFLKRIKSALFDRRKQLNTVKKNARSKDADVQKQAINDLLKIKSDIKKDKADLTRMAKQIASNNEKIRQLLAGAKL